MSELFLIVGSACVGFSFAEVSGIPQAISRFILDRFNIGQELKQYNYIKVPYRLKPFDCGYCLSFWFSFLVGLHFEYGILLSLIFGFSSSIVAIALKKLL